MVKTEWIARRGRFTAPTADKSAKCDTQLIPVHLLKLIIGLNSHQPEFPHPVILSAAKDLSDQSSIRTPCKDVKYMISLSLTFHNISWYSKH